jgi:phosphoglycolate phosphatase
MKPKLVKRALVFDLDGTLVDSLPGIAASLNRVLEAHGLPIHSLPAIRNFIGNGARVLVERASATHPEAVSPELLEASFKLDYDGTWASGTLVYEGIHPLLEAARASGYLLAVLSNKPHPFTRSIVEALFPDAGFACVLGQRPGMPLKPDPAGALEIASGLGVAPAACVIIGDSTMDLQTARNAHMKAIGVTWGYHDPAALEAAGAAALCSHPAALEGLIAQVAGFA